MRKSIIVQTSSRLVSSSSSSYSTSPLFDFRRLKTRGQVKAARQEEDRSDTVLAWNESEFSNSEINWILNRYQITPAPHANVYRNLHVRGLKMLSDAKLGEKGALEAKPSPSDHQVFFLPSSGKSQYKNTINETVWKHIGREVKKDLSNHAQLFIQDGYFGSAQDTIPFRFVSNSALPAFIIQKALGRVSSKMTVGEFKPKGTVLILDTSLPSSEFSLEGTGLTGKNFTLIDEASNRTYIVGENLTPHLIKEAMVAAAGGYFIKEESMLLPAALITRADGNNTLVFNPEHKDLQSSSSSGSGIKVFSPNYSIWNSYGVSRLWNLSWSSSSSSLAKDDLVDTVNGAKVYTKQEISSNGNLAFHPDSIVFLSSSAPSVSTVTGEKVNETFLKSLGSFPLPTEHVAKTFVSVVEENSIPCYVAKDLHAVLDKISSQQQQQQSGTQQTKKQ